MNSQVKTGKIYVIDTSVLMHDPSALDKFSSDGNVVVVPQCVIQELDSSKKYPDERGVNSRTVSRILDEYRQKGSLREGVKTKFGGFVMVLNQNGKEFDKFVKKTGLDKNNDNRIIFIAIVLKEEQQKKGGGKVAIISKDTNIRILANSNGVAAEDYENDKSITNIDELYSGFLQIKLQPEEEELISKLYIDKTVNVGGSDFHRISARNSLISNECCELIKADSEKSALAVFKYNGSPAFSLVEKPKDLHKGDKENAVHPKNNGQCFAYKLLIDASISLVSLVGKAGTGKTLISLLAGYQMLGKGYEQLLVYRPNIPLGPDIGFLPGEINEKFAPWMKPIFDNLELIIKEDDRKKISGKYEAYELSSFSEIIRHYMERGLLSIEPIIYIRGRSWNKKFVIIDEAQNLTPHQIKTIITRAGKGTKIVLTGDCSQIDNPYLDSVSNGLSYVIERMKDQSCFGHITLTQGERSPLSELASQLL